MAPTMTVSTTDWVLLVIMERLRELGMTVARADQGRLSAWKADAVTTIRLINLFIIYEEYLFQWSALDLGLHALMFRIMYLLDTMIP